MAIPIKRIFLILTFGLVLYFIYSTYIIEMNVKKICLSSQATFGGDYTEALLRAAKANDGCAKNTYKIFWAMGQWGDPRLLPYLKETFEYQDEESLCIHEAKFATEKLEREIFNLPKFLWRWLWT